MKNRYRIIAVIYGIVWGFVDSLIMTGVSIVSDHSRSIVALTVLLLLCLLLRIALFFPSLSKKAFISLGLAIPSFVLFSFLSIQLKTQSLYERLLGIGSSLDVMEIGDGTAGLILVFFLAAYVVFDLLVAVILLIRTAIMKSKARE